MAEVNLSDETDSNRYVLELGGRRAGLIDYRLGNGQIALVHAEIDPELEGQGLGSQLAAFALDDARERGLAVLPACPFVASFIGQHPEYADLVPEAHRSRFGL